MADEAKLARRFVERRVGELLNTSNDSAARAALARLRRGVGRHPGNTPDAWSSVLADMPEELYGPDGNPSRGEWAVYLALTLFALHQQGKDRKSQPMHVPGPSLGAAVRRLAKTPEDEERVKRRLDAALTADSPEELSHHLRGLVQLLKSEGIPLDYAALTGDLYWFQSDGARDRVRLKWGQDFYRRGEKDAAGKDESNE